MDGRVGLEVRETDIVEQVRLEEIVSFKTGKLNSNAAKPDGEYPFFTCSQEVFRTDTYSFDTECVLLGGNNASGIYPLKYYSGKFDAYQRTYVIRSLDGRKLMNRYLYYALHPKLDMLKNISTGVATKFLTLTILNNIKIEIPHIKAQHKIASILSAYDDLIENNNRRIKILKEMAQTIYREWFVNFRFPGHEKVKMVKSELGMIPEGWEVKKLGDVTKINERSIKKDNAPEDILYVDISSVSTGFITDTIPYKFTDAPGRARRRVQHGDIIWSSVRPNRKSYALIINPDPRTIVSTGFGVISPVEVPYTFLYEAVTTDEFVGYLTNSTRGSAYPAVNTEDYERADILVPTEGLMDKFHETVEHFYILKNNMQKRNNILLKTRDLLLPKLISGEIDVEGMDIMISEEVN
ncbi:MAG: restriction endonuclease subunit S [Nitrospirae bacterium]|nr:restriction endonuclease subunit S [Nitrospirota bacterium]